MPHRRKACYGPHSGVVWQRFHASCIPQQHRSCQGIASREVDTITAACDSVDLTTGNSLAGTVLLWDAGSVEPLPYDTRVWTVTCFTPMVHSNSQTIMP